MPYTALDPSTAAAAPTVTAGAPLLNTGETLLSMRDELRLMLGNRTDIPKERYDKWLNWAYVDLAASLKLDELKSSYTFDTVADQPFYLLPAAVASTRGASLVSTSDYPGSGGVPLRKSSVEEYRGARLEDGVPRAYFKEGKMLVLWPTPDDVYTISVDYIVRPEYLVAETDSPILPIEFHETIVLNAKQKGFAALMEFDKAAASNNDLVGNIRRKGDTAADEDIGRVVASSVPRTPRDIWRPNTPTELGD